MALRHVTPPKQSDISRIKYSIPGGKKKKGKKKKKQVTVLVLPQGEFFGFRNVNED